MVKKFAILEYTKKKSGIQILTSKSSSSLFGKIIIPERLRQLSLFWLTPDVFFFLSQASTIPLIFISFHSAWSESKFRVQCRVLNKCIKEKCFYFQYLPIHASKCLILCCISALCLCSFCSTSFSFKIFHLYGFSKLVLSHRYIMQATYVISKCSSIT